MEEMKQEKTKVVFRDPENKLYTIGFQDGKEKTKRNLENDLPTDIEFLNPRGPKEYIEGFILGSEEAFKEYNEKENSEKTR